jgi:SAM-dependent methyltransferase
MYHELAEWWPLLSDPADYVEEAAYYRQLLDSTGNARPETVLELGCGGGHNASHLKRHYRMTLVDRSEGKLQVSRALNPECEHLPGDMRTVRLGRTFDAVFIHDAVDYLTSAEEVRQALVTAFVHCRPGGVLVIAPDFVRETFEAYTSSGGHDGPDRGMRYLEWTWDPEPADSQYVIDFAYLLRRGEGPMECLYDRHVCGLFGREEWLDLMRAAGFQARAVDSPTKSEVESLVVLVGVRRAE